MTKRSVAFWDPGSQNEYHQVVDDHVNQLLADLTISYRGDVITLRELVERLIKVEDALADYIILGDKNVKG